MTDPYSVLGVSRDAGTDEIKKAYRKLSRIYHPDANINNPDKDKAEEKFKQIQEAYNQIMDEREHGGGQSSYQNGYGNGYGSYGYGGFGSYSNSSGYGSDSTRLNAAINYINSGHFAEAMNVLESMDASERNARWYYVRAHANYGMGNTINATQDARTAVNMEPGNSEYAMFLNNLENGGTWYRNMGRTYTTTSSGSGNCCARLLCLELLCNCCCCGGMGGL